MYRGTNGCMYNCGDICTRECMKPMQEITDYKIKPKFDEEGNILSYDIIAQLKKGGLKIEERELSLEERYDWYIQTHNKNLTRSSNQFDMDDILNSNNCPTKLITITYNDIKTEIYE